jgi:hypothetical protein
VLDSGPGGQDAPESQPSDEPVGDSTGVLSPRQFEPAAPESSGDDEGGSPVLKALGRAVKAVARNADKSVFPGLLAALVMCFFAVQNRIDRNDPKLGLAPVFADPDLEFRPPEPKE